MTHNNEVIDNLRIEEYKALRSQIDSQSRLQVQIFTFSIISSSALIGYLLRFFHSTEITSVTVYIFFAPCLIYIPCAYLVKDMRDEIYRWGAYIFVFIENESSQHYEGALSKMRDRFSSSESFNPMFGAFWSFTFACEGLSIFFIINNQLNWWVPMPWILVAFTLGHAHKKFNDIPCKSRKEYIRHWKTIKTSARLV